MAEFSLPPGHPYSNVRPGYAGFQSAAVGSIVSATASYVGAAGDYTNNTVTLQLYATQGGTWNITTPDGLTLVTPAGNGQIYTTAVYTGGIKGQTYSFTSISLTPTQGSAFGWTGLTPSVKLEIPSQRTSIASAYYVGGNAIYLTADVVSTLIPLAQGITGYFFTCTTSAAYVSVDSTSTATIPFPVGASFVAGTTTSLDFTVACRSNGILGSSSVPYTVGIRRPAIPVLVAALASPNINLTWTETTPGCTFNLSTGGSITTNVTSPYSYVTPSPGVYNFAIEAVLAGLGTYSATVSSAIAPVQPSAVSYTVSGLSVSLAWTPLGIGYTYTVSGTGLAAQNTGNPTITFNGVAVGSSTFYLQSKYADVVSTVCNVQVNVITTKPYNFTSAVTGTTITLTWSSDTPGATYNITEAALGPQTGITDNTVAYTSVPGGSYSFVIVAVSAGIASSSESVPATVILTAPTNFTVTTLSSTATLNWQVATLGSSFNISYAVASVPKSKVIASGLTSTTISSLPAGSYTFGIQSIVTGASSAFANTNATVVADPTDFTSRSTGSTLSLSWVESTTGCTFLTSNAVLGIKTAAVGVSNVQYTNVSPGSYIVSLTPSNTTSFIGATISTTATVLATPVPSAVLSGTNVNVSWPAITGCIYTVSSSPTVVVPPADPGSSLTVTYVNPVPNSYKFFVTATDASGNVSLSGSTTSLTVPVPTPSNVAAVMTSSSALTVTWNEGLPGCTFTITGGPPGITPVISGTNPYTAVFSGVPADSSYTMTVKATANSTDSAVSQSATAYTFTTFTASISATCTFNGTTHVANVSYNLVGSSGELVNPAAKIFIPPTRLTVRVFSGTTIPPVIDVASGVSGSFFVRFNTTSNILSNLVPQTFTSYVVPPSNVVSTASGTTLTVKWADSTTTGCTYSVSGSAGNFISNNLAAGSGTTGVQFTGAAADTGYTFIVTASASGISNLTQAFMVTGNATPVTTQTTGIPYQIDALSPSSTSIKPIAAPTGFTAFATGATIAITWNAVAVATGYNVFNGTTNLFSTTTATSCNYAGTVGTTYTLNVQAVSNSSASNTTTSITVIPLPAPTITSIRQAGGTIYLTSPAPTAGITLSANTPGTLNAPTGTSTFIYTGAQSNTAYTFTLSANRTNSVAVTNSNFTTLGTPVIGSTFSTGTQTITTNWTYTGTVTPTSFDIFSNNVVVSNVGSAIRTVTFNQTDGVPTYAVFIVAKDSATSSESFPTSTCNVTGLTVKPTSVVASANALGFTVQWVYPIAALALSNFQVWNSIQTISFGPAVDYTPASQNYTRLFDVPSAGSYSFVVIGKDSVGGSVVSAATTSVTTVAQPVISSVIQTMSSILISCGAPAGGVTLSVPTLPTGLTASTTTATTFKFTGAGANTLYTFGVQATGTGASNTATSNITTLATPAAPIISSSGTTITLAWPSAATYNIYSNTIVTPATSNTTNATITSGITTGTTYTYTIALTSGGNTSIQSTAASITPVAPPIVTLVSQSGANIVVGCSLTVSIVTVTVSGSTAGSYTYPLTSFVGSVSISASIIGGGGGGGAGGNGLNVYAYAPAGGGGGSGGTNTVVCNAITSIAYVVGAGGTGGIMSTTPTSGTTGGTSMITLNGGPTAAATATGGGGGNPSSAAGGGGTPGGFSGGVGGMNAIGATGAGGGGQGGPKGFNNSQGGGGGGGGPGGGNGGGGQQPQTTVGTAGNGGNGSQPGAGGGGGGSIYVLGSGGNGGAGAAGGIILTISGPQYTPLSISTITPPGLSPVSATISSFVYTNYTPGTTYTFTVQATSEGSTNITTGTVTPLYTPGTPTASSSGKTVTVTWTYGGNFTGVTFNIVDLNNANTLLTSVVGALTVPFTATGGVQYSIAVYATGSGNTSPTSPGTSVQVIEAPIFSQNYQKTTQTTIVGTAAAVGATSYSGTQGTGSLLSVPTAVGGVLTWTGATAGTAYSGITIGATAGATTTTLANQALQSAFSPTSVPACVLWLDGADPNNTGTAPASGAISQWKDRSGNGNNSTLCVGTYNAAARSITNPVISGPVPNSGSSTVSIFVVATLSICGNTYDNLLALNSSSITNYNLSTAVHIARFGGAEAPGIYGYTNGNLLVGTNQDTVNTPFVYDLMLTGALSETYLDGVLVGGGAWATAGNTFNYTKYYIGECTGGPAWNGTVAEILIYNSALTSTQRQAIEGYLAWKWGKQGSLSSTNPYSPLAIPPAIAPPIVIAPPSSVTFLVVGGGGGGGSRFGGGGGAGGFLSGTLAVTASTPFTVTVGTGGAGGAGSGGGGIAGASNGGKGNSSVFDGIISIGGGGGGAGDTLNGLAGGSGGGGAGRKNGDVTNSPYPPPGTIGGAGTSGQGNSGSGGINTSYVGGGGGGAGAAAVSTTGAVGKTSSITGISVTYAGGGGGGGTADGKYGGFQNGAAGGAGGGGAGGGWDGDKITPSAGIANTGGGGGGGSFNTNSVRYPGNNQPGAAGGSGIVILSYPTTFRSIASIGSGLTQTMSVVGTNFVYVFTAGTGNITW